VHAILRYTSSNGICQHGLICWLRRLPLHDLGNQIFISFVQPFPNDTPFPLPILFIFSVRLALG
jgi:hypothetical protein